MNRRDTSPEARPEYANNGHERRRDRFGPLSAARTRSKSSKPFRRRTPVKAVTDLPIVQPLAKYAGSNKILYCLGEPITTSSDKRSAERNA